MDDFDRFAGEVGLLIEGELERLEALGFSKRDFEGNGSFDTDMLRDLAAFCEQHPEYHIVTQCDEGYYNQVRSVNRLCYYLADGNKDRGLYVEPCEVCGYWECECED